MPRSTALLGLMMAGCAATGPAPPAGATAPAVVEASPGGETRLAVGQRLQIAEQANPSTGYGWEFVEDGAPLLREVEAPAALYEAQRRDDPPRVGAPAARYWHFLAEQPGTTTLRMVYRRAWEQGRAPLQERHYTVVVTAPSP